MSADIIAGHVADGFAHPLAIVALIVICLWWGRSKHDNNLLTLLLSILALSLSQLILLDAARTDAATQAKLDAIIQATAAPDALVRAEDHTTDEIERMRR